jgi:ABC-type transport system substrate-binding protein
MRTTISALPISSKCRNQNWFNFLIGYKGASMRSKLIIIMSVAILLSACGQAGNNRPNVPADTAGQERVILVVPQEPQGNADTTGTQPVIIFPDYTTPFTCSTLRSLYVLDAPGGEVIGTIDADLLLEIKTVSGDKKYFEFWAGWIEGAFCQR